MITMLIPVADIDIGEDNKSFKNIETISRHAVLAPFLYPKNKREIPKKLPEDQNKIPISKKNLHDDLKNEADNHPADLYCTVLFSKLSDMFFGITETITENMPDNCKASFFGLSGIFYGIVRQLFGDLMLFVIGKTNGN